MKLIEFDDEDFGGYIYTNIMEHIQLGTMIDRPLLSVTTPCRLTHTSIRQLVRKHHSLPVNLINLPHL